MKKLVLLLLVVTSGSAASQQRTATTNACRGEPVAADLGYDGITCRSCTFTNGYAEYLTEPTVSDIRRGGPAEGKLRDGDVIVAVEGALITTRSGWRRMRDLEPGEPVTLTIRRNGYERDVTITPGARCSGRNAEAEVAEEPSRRSAPRVLPSPLRELSDDTRELAATQRARAAEEARSLVEVMRDSLLTEIRREREREAELRAMERYTRAQNQASQLRLRRPGPATAVATRANARGWIGVAIECGGCGAVAAGRTGIYRWTFEQPPVVSEVVAGGPAAVAGIRAGDVLLEIDGRRITTSAGGSRWGQIRPGESVMLTVRRGRDTRSVEVVARERSDAATAVLQQALPPAPIPGFRPAPRSRFELSDSDSEASSWSRATPSRHFIGDAIVELEGRYGDMKVEREGDHLVIRGPDFTIRVRPRD